jgi:hypothetical protein
MSEIEIKPQARNANRHTQRGMQALETSLAQDGWIGAITVAADGETFDGSARVEKTAENGMLDGAIVVDSDGSRPIVVRRIDIPTATDERAVRLGIAANRVASLNLEWEPDVLAGIADSGVDLGSLFTADEWRDVSLPSLPEAGAGGDEFDTTPEDGPTRTQVGELWSIGGVHRLLVGDCTDPANVARLMGGERARFEFADPPYEIETVGGGLFQESAAMRAIERANIDTFDPAQLSSESPTAVFCCNKPLVPAYIRLAESRKVSWDICFYLKENVTPNYGGHMMTDVEYLMLLGNQGPIGGQEKELYSKAYIGGLDVNNDVAWQKPVGLVEKYIRLYSEVGTIILDRFAGTGTTMIAAHRQGRYARIVELLPRMADVILRRAEAEGMECNLIDG